MITLCWLRKSVSDLRAFESCVVSLLEIRVRRGLEHTGTILFPIARFLEEHGVLQSNHLVILKYTLLPAKHLRSGSMRPA